MRKLLAALIVIGGLLTALDASTDTTDFLPSRAPGSAGKVVLLHGLARSASSMEKMQTALQADGFEVCNIDYPSRDHSIEILAEDFVAPAITKCFVDRDAVTPINFVTHSLGGIIVRQLAATHAITNFGRVVMLSPPNQGSEVVDKLGGLKLFDWINGPAGGEIGTGDESLPLRLGKASFEVGIITGVRSINPFLSMMIPGDDDGKVGIDNAKLDGMNDFLVLRCSHPYIMKSDHGIEQSIYFLNHGKFRHTATTADGNLLGTPQQPESCWD
jgi:triacylglycerol lipase